MSDEGEELPEIDEAVLGTGEGDHGDATEESVEAGKQLAAASGVGPPDLGLIMEVPLRLSVELGSATIPVRDVLALSKGSVVELDRQHGEPAEIYVNDRLVARGELTTADERAAIRITELIAVKAATGVG